MSKKRIDMKNDSAGESSLPVLFMRHWKIIVPAIVLVISFVAWNATRPIQGSVYFGICRTFLETQVRYPKTIDLTAVEWIENSLRVYFTHTDAYGEHRSEIFECRFNKKAQTLAIQEARRNRMLVAAEKVKAYNKTIPFVVAARPNLDIPPRQGEDLMDLQRN